MVIFITMLLTSLIVIEIVAFLSAYILKKVYRIGMWRIFGYMQITPIIGSLYVGIVALAFS